MEKKDRVVCLMGRKLGMTQLFDEKSVFVAVTAIEVEACPVTAVRSDAKDGYDAIQIAAGLLAKPGRCCQATEGSFKKLGLAPHRYLKEFCVQDSSLYAVGDIMELSLLQEGGCVDVRGITKGRSFQGVVKRYGFSGGPGAHGSMFHRRGGSFGMREEPGRVYRGRKMPGHMGAVTRTLQSLEIVKICVDEGILFVKGSVVGPRG
ncbi:MAG: 50S ribosomal protein L3, partial [Puniceicoccales bacterium]|nr:50S ribosomal protein L3 [Puniceicoccales bacterium]